MTIEHESINNFPNPHRMDDDWLRAIGVESQRDRDRYLAVQASLPEFITFCWGRVALIKAMFMGGLFRGEQQNWEAAVLSDKNATARQFDQHFAKNGEGRGADVRTLFKVLVQYAKYQEWVDRLWKRHYLQEVVETSLGIVPVWLLREAGPEDGVPIASAPIHHYLEIMLATRNFWVAEYGNARCTFVRLKLVPRPVVNLDKFLAGEHPEYFGTGVDRRREDPSLMDLINRHVSRAVRGIQWGEDCEFVIRSKAGEGLVEVEGSCGFVDIPRFMHVVMGVLQMFVYPPDEQTVRPAGSCQWVEDRDQGFRLKWDQRPNWLIPRS